MTAAVWRGGDERIEAPLLDQAATVIAYGDEPALADLERIFFCHLTSNPAERSLR